VTLTSFLNDPVSTHGIPLAIVPEEDEVILRVQLHILHEGVVLMHSHWSPGLSHHSQAHIVLLQYCTVTVLTVLTALSL